MDNRTVAEHAAQEPPPGLAFFEHADEIARVLEKLGHDEFMQALIAGGWDVGVEQAAQELVRNGVGLPEIARAAVLELRATLKSTGYMDLCDQALLLVAEYHLAADGAVELTIDNELDADLGANAAAHDAQTLANLAKRGDVENFFGILRSLVANLGCKAQGPSAHDRGRAAVRSLAQGLLARFGALEVQS